MSRGPASGSSEVVFERPRPLHDCRHTFRRMEADGLFKKNPGMDIMARSKLNDLKRQDAEGSLKNNTDYSKGDHPLQRTLSRPTKKEIRAQYDKEAAGWKKRHSKN